MIAEVTGRRFNDDDVNPIAKTVAMRTSSEGAVSATNAPTASTALAHRRARRSPTRSTRAPAGTAKNSSAMSPSPTVRAATDCDAPRSRALRATIGTMAPPPMAAMTVGP